MDRKTFIQFLFVSGAILLLWYVVMGLFGQRLGLRPPEEEAPQAQQDAPPAAGQEAPTAVTRRPTDIEEESFVGDREVERNLVLQNAAIRTSWTNRGAALEWLQLVRYGAPFMAEEDAGKTRERLKLLRDFEEGRLSDVIESARYSFVQDDEEGREVWSNENPTAGVVYEVVDRSDSHIIFEGTLYQRRKLHLWPVHVPRLKVRKRVDMGEGLQGYHYDVKLDFTNVAQEPLRFAWRLRGPAGIETEKSMYRPIRTAVGCREGRNKYNVSYVAAKNLPKKPNRSTNIVWAGTVNKYFVALLQPQRSDRIDSVASELVVDSDLLRGERRGTDAPPLPADPAKRARLARSNMAVVIQSAPVPLAPGETYSFAYRMVATPKLDAVLEQYGSGMTKAVEYGWFPRLSGWLVSILHFFHSVIPNYGIAILMLTLLVKLVLSPLSWKSQTSMHKMQQLGPKLTELKKKFGDDRQRMGQETMQLYRRYGVHPMSGCWPMMLQMPIFFALFGALRNAVDLRHAVFIPGWVTDLSQPDTVAHFPLFLPLIGGVPVNILPVLMVAMSFLSQRFHPKSTDPQAQQQQKMMKWMPLLFAVLLYRFASGLLLYWTASTSLGIIEHWLIRKRLANVGLRPVGEEEAKAKIGKRNEPSGRGLFGRLTDAVENQQKRSRTAQKRKKRR